MSITLFIRLSEYNGMRKLNEERLVIGLNGAGHKNNPGNAATRKFVQSQGGQMMSIAEAKHAIKGAPDISLIILFGYSRGGNACVRLANWAGKHDFFIHKLTLIDPHIFWGSALKLKYDNVGGATNYYQQNPRTGGALGFWGLNPRHGYPIQSKYFQVNNIDLTGKLPLYGHHDIVGRITGCH